MCDEAEPRSENMCGGAIINKVSTCTTHIKRPSGMNDGNIHFPRIQMHRQVLSNILGRQILVEKLGSRIYILVVTQKL